MTIDVIVKIKRCFSIWTGVSNAERPSQRSEVRGQKSKVCLPTFDVGRWMLDVGRFPLSAFRSFSGPQPTAHSLQPSSRSGIALIMVLGVLSVMVIMAVAFAIAMRTERLAAGNYADSVRARQLVQTGLARALDDLAKLGANGLMSAGGGTNYPPWIVTNSYTNTSVFSDGATIITNQATNFVPRALWAAAINADTLDAANHWLAIDSLVFTNYTTNTYLAASNRMGRVKHLILNCSGLLDANFVGGSNRVVGAHSMEIAITNMPEMQSAAVLVNNRDDDYRYETLEELAVLNPGAFNDYPSNFTVYSHAPAGYWAANWQCAATQVNLAGTDGQLKLPERKAAITNGFVQAGFTTNQANILFNNLYNYMMGGAIPFIPGISDTADYTDIVKAVPMINEILLESFVDGPGARNVITFELWFPFVTPAPADYKMDVKVDLSAGADIEQLDVVIPIAGTNFAQLSFESPDPGNNSPYTFTIQNAEVQTAVGAPVDKFLDPTPTTPSAPVITGGDKVSYQCIDPRFNWNLFNVQQWVLYTGPGTSGTLGETNASTVTYMAANPDCDQDGAMYVAGNGEPLSSVGELGYLAYDLWKTVKLYGPNLKPVLDIFAIGTNVNYIYVTNTVWRGRVNPNSREREALSAVFSNMPIDQYSVESSPPKLNNAAEIQAVINNMQDAGYIAYTNLSAIGRNFTAFPAAADNELKKEAIFRNTAGLLSARQNLFTIIIEAQVASGGNIPRSPIRQKAVALVWRDPYTGEMFVRSIKWLKD